MTYYSTVDEAPVRQMTLTLRRNKLWIANVSLASAPKTLSGGVKLRLNDLEMQGFIVRVGSFAGAGSYRIVGGFGGWRKPVASKSYQNPFGVTLSLILRDVAREVGERVEIAQDRKVGPHYIRSADPASLVLGALAPDWYVREDGVTVIGKRARRRITSRYETHNARPEAAMVLITPDRPDHWVPGAVFTSPHTPGLREIDLVVHRLTEDKLSSEVWHL